MPLDPQLLSKYVLKYFSGYKVTTADEDGCCGYYIHRCFDSYGWDSLVVNSTDIHMKGKERQTNSDRLDVQLLARELKDIRIESIHVPDIECEQLRSLFHRRSDLVKNYRTIKNLIRVFLMTRCCR